MNSTSDPNNASLSSSLHHPACAEVVSQAVSTCISIITVLLGIPAGVGVLWQLFQKLRSGDPATPNDVFILNLTVMDFIFAAFNPLEILIDWYSMPSETRGNLVYANNFIYAFTVTGRPLFMTCICLDCYLAVVHPIMYRARKGLTSRMLTSIVVWAVTLVYGAMYVVFNVHMLTNPAGVLPSIITISTIAVCDFFILRALRSSGPGGRDLHPQKKKALQIVINSLVMTVVAYFPLCLTFVLLNSKISMSQEMLCNLYMFSGTTAAAGSVVMPILYLNNLGKMDCIWMRCHRTT